MAEALQFEFPISDSSKESSEDTLKGIRLTQTQKKEPKTPTSDLPELLGESTPEEYTIDTYYKGDDLGKEVLQNKYLAPWEKGPYDMWKRIAKAVASIEENDKLWYQKYFSILEDFRFVPGGRIMHGAGREDITTTLNNCYVVAIRNDSINAIYNAIREEAITYKYGGGCGHDLSILRPAGTAIESTGGGSCGPIGFMNLFSENTNTIAQHGRRGANMQTLRVDHPDIGKFIEIKQDPSMVKYSNTSVLLTHEFRNAVEKNLDFNLRWGGRIYKTVKARDLWDRIFEAAHATAEPGIIFWDTMREYHNTEYCSPLVSTNPCGEQPLPDGGCCNLGSINLDRFVDADSKFLEEEFKETVAIATRFMDNVVDYNMDRHALPIQKENAMNDRRVGLGLLGLGDMFVRKQIAYDSEEALKIAERICNVFRDTAYSTSIELAKEKGSFPNFQWEGFSRSKFIRALPEDIISKINKHGIRNSTLLTVPPTGSGAIIARVTSGIEPIFQTSYFRRVKQNEGKEKNYKEYKIFHPTIYKLFDTDENLPDYIVTSHEIDPYFRVKMQGVIQKYIDTSISSTVNLPSDVSKETVADIYKAAYHAGLKGITVYRESSREGILISEKEKTVQESRNSTSPVEETQTRQPSSSSTREINRVSDLKPRVRPFETCGVTKRIRTGEGSLYITINEDEKGLCEVFTTIGKAGGNAAAQSEAISRLISLALRSGINPGDVVKQLKGISGPHPTWENGQLVLSTPDAIGKALEDYLNEYEHDGQANLFKNSNKTRGTRFSLADNPAPSEVSADYNPRTMTTCPDCGSTMFHENGCATCPSCGYSKCT